MLTSRPGGLSIPMNRRHLLQSLALGAALPGGSGEALAKRVALPRTSQLLLGIADDWSSTRGTLYPFHRDRGGKWTPSFKESIPILLGRNGLAWGRGAVPNPSPPVKREGDRKAPAGYFSIGLILGYEAALPAGSDAKLPYRRVTKWDAWPDDPNHPHYNQHLVIDPSKGVPSWFESQRMRLGDFAYHWLIEIRHNVDPKPVPGGGSAIFFHIRRGPDRPSFGCTTMKKSDLENVLRWLRHEANPHYVLLPKAEYRKLQGSWDLPSVAV